MGILAHGTFLHLRFVQWVIMADMSAITIGRPIVPLRPLSGLYTMVLADIVETCEIKTNFERGVGECTVKNVEGKWTIPQ